MCKTNRSWPASLYQLSNLYKDSRKNILDISTKLNISRNDITWGDLTQPKTLCILTALDLINEAIIEFIMWEKETFYLHHNFTLHYENFISHTANDMVRGLGKLDGFISGFIYHLQRIEIAAKSSTCNETKWDALLQKITNVVKHTNGSISAFYKEYNLLFHIVKSNQQIRSYRYPDGDSSEEYARWSIMQWKRNMCWLVHYRYCSSIKVNVHKSNSLQDTGATNPPTMMTSSNGNIFLVTDPLCGEFAGHR